jgi:hypothetical protein
MGLAVITLSKAAVLIVISFLFVILIYSSVVKFDASARQRLPATATSCVAVKPDTTHYPNSVAAERCCDTTTYFNSAGLPTHSSTSCQTCQYSGGGGRIDCTSNSYGAPSPGGVKPPQSVGNAQPPPPPPPPTNVLPPGNNNTVSIIKLPPGTAKPTGTATNPSNGGGSVFSAKGGAGAGKTTINNLPTTAIHFNSTNSTTPTPPSISAIRVPSGTTNPAGTAMNPGSGGKTAMAESSGGGGQTETCLPGQTANTELGTCQDPVCGPGQVRDPTGQTRYCVDITCPPGESFNSDINQCVVNPIPPPPKCPDGTVGLVIHEPNGISVVECPKSIITGTSPLGGIIKIPSGAAKAFPVTSTGNKTNSSIARLSGGAYSPTGYCVRNNPSACLPCDPGLPGGQQTCIPSSEWPPSISLPLGGKVAPPLGSIIKVSPGTTNALPTTNNGTGGNATGTLPALTVTKEHNPSSPNILNLAPNATNPSNNTSTLKLSPLTGQHIQTPGHHHHKASTSTSLTGSNSTGH